VESGQQARPLHEWGCDQAQGRLFGEPLELGDLRTLLASQVAGPPAFAQLLGIAVPSAARHA
jgi:hypothetical protein